MSVEQKVNEQWNKAIENTIVKAGYGAVAAMVSAFILFRSPMARASISCLGLGIGIGYSLSENKFAFEKAGRQVRKEAKLASAEAAAAVAKSD